MKRLIALIAVFGLFAAAPLLAQQIETLPSGKKIKIVEKDDGTVIILPVDEEEETKKVEKKTDEKSTDDIFEEIEIEDDFDGELPTKVKDLLEKLRKDLERDTEDDAEAPEGKFPRIKIRGWGEDEDFDKDMPEEMRKALEEMRERMKKFREEADKRFEKLRKEMEEELENEDWENDPDTEVEEYEKEAPDGSWKVKIKIVRKTSKSGSKTPETPKKSESERKQ